MMGFVFIGIITLFWGLEANSAAITCGDIDLHCPSKDFHDAVGDEPFSLLNEENLNLHCSDLLSDFQCKRDFLAACRADDLETYDLITDGLKSLFTELCNDSSELRKEFHLYSACLWNTSTLYENCVFHSIVDNSNAEYSDESEDDREQYHNHIIAKMCQLYEPLKSCAIRETRGNCGDATATFLDLLISRATSKLIQTKCA